MSTGYSCSGPFPPKTRPPALSLLNLSTYNSQMNPTPASQPSSPQASNSLLHKIIKEAQEAFRLTLYLAAWFCAITFLGLTALHERPIPLTIFGLAFIKAAICAKFMLISLAISPIAIDKQRGIIWLLLRKSLFCLFIVMIFSWIEVGVDGLIHGKDFIPSLGAFGGGDPLHILALAIVYWLIVAPFLFFLGVKMALGVDETSTIFYGSSKQSK